MSFSFTKEERQRFRTIYQRFHNLIMRKYVNCYANHYYEGHGSMVFWFKEIGYDRTVNVLRDAIKDGNLEILIYLVENGAKIHSWGFNESIRNGHIDIAKYLYDRDHTSVNFASLWIAAEYGHIEIIKWLIQINCKIDDLAISGAARNGHLEVIKLLRDHGCPWYRHTIALAANYGGLEVVKWLVLNGCPWDSSTIDHNMETRHPKIVKWLKDNSPRD